MTLPAIDASRWVDAGRSPKVLMVCLGNICRSPTAEAALREAALRVGFAIEVDSAGTAGWHTGNPPDDRTVAAAADAGLIVAGAARQVTQGDFADFDLLIAMDASNLADLLELAPTPDDAQRVLLFRAFEAGRSRPGEAVPDPYYGGPDGFAEVVTICRESAAGLLQTIQRATD